MLQITKPVKKVLASWGPGKFDAQLNLDGKAFRPDGKPAATLNPPAFGLAGVNNHTWTGAWGTVTYWNAYVATLRCKGRASSTTRLNDAEDIRLRPGPGTEQAGRERHGHLEAPAAPFLSARAAAPEPARGHLHRAAAARGETLFNGKARCAQCHVPPIFTEPGWNPHKPADIGIDDFQSNRSPDKSYRTSPRGP